MKIEEEIRQKNFLNSWQKAQINLMYTANFWRELETTFFSGYRISPQQYNVMRILKGKHPEPVSPGQIKEVMLDKGIDLTRLVDKLELLELVHRQICPDNRRKVEITLSEKGLMLLNDILPEIEKKTNDLKTLLTKQEAELLSDLLDKIRG